MADNERLPEINTSFSTQRRRRDSESLEGLNARQIGQRRRRERERMNNDIQTINLQQNRITATPPQTDITHEAHQSTNLVNILDTIPQSLATTTQIGIMHNLDSGIPNMGCKDGFTSHTWKGSKLIHNTWRIAPSFLKERTILSARNDDVSIINNVALSLFPGEKVVYLAADKISDEDELDRTITTRYPTEYINSLDPAGLPPFKLELKVGVPVMLLRNIAPEDGLCNDTRLIVVRCGIRVIEGRILTGDKEGNLVFIPRISLTPSSSDLPFRMSRRQFPLRLAYAVTINKSQGQSVKIVGVDLRTPVFSHGQLYVAFSRCTDFDGVTVLVPEDGSTSTKDLIQKLLTMRESNIGRWKAIKDSFDFYESQHQFDTETESCVFDSGELNPMPSWDDHVLGQNHMYLRTFVGTWNVAGKTPHNGLYLDDFLQIHGEWDMYILGFQEIVPLNAGNVLVKDDNEPAANWLDLINQSLNKSAANYCLLYRRLSNRSDTKSNSSLFSKKPSLRKFSKKFRTESKRRLKTCNCATHFERRFSINHKDSCFKCEQSTLTEDDLSSDDDDGIVEDSTSDALSSTNDHMKYSLVVSKQMVGIFVTIWMKKELVPHVGHLRVSCTGRGIMGYLGNKGCIAVSMSFYQTSLCFICSHLTSGEREGDELRRNSDVMEILKSTQFRKICKFANIRVPDKILDHARVIWLGDLNYRVGLSYSEARRFLERKDWDSLLDKDQLKVEREAGRVFQGFQEGNIYFAPTYKYSYNTDTYVGETLKTRSKRRTPAWCDRILWQGNGIRQLSYLRGESRFSDHRPVSATFLVDVFGIQ